MESLWKADDEWSKQNNTRSLQQDKWQVVNGVQTVKCSSLARGNNCPVNQCSIVASRGDLARNNCTARETPAPCIVDKRKKTADADASGTRAKHRDDNFVPGERDAKHAEGSTDLRKGERPIRKSFSVPDCLREGISFLSNYLFSFSSFVDVEEDVAPFRFFEWSLTLCHLSIFKTRDARSNIE